MKKTFITLLFGFISGFVTSQYFSSNVGITIDQVDKTIQSKPEVLTDDSTANNFEIVSDQDLKSDLTQKFIKSRYKKSVKIDIDGKLIECFIKNSKFEGEGDFRGKYCVNLVKISKDKINGSTFIYAVETGVMLEENMHFEPVHASGGGLVKFYKFEEINKDYKLVSESEDIQSGSWGSPPNIIKNYRIGDGSGLGWITIWGDMHQGYAGSRVDIYASNVNRIKSIGHLQIESSDGEACNDPDGCDSVSLSTEIGTIPATDKKYFDLSTITTGTIIRNKVEEKINRKIIVRFNEKKFNYVTDEFTKVYEGHEDF